MSSGGRRTLDEIELGERVSRHLGEVGEPHAFRVAGITVSRRRRRPSGEPAPLPRELRVSGRFWLLMGVLGGLIWVSLFAWTETTRWWTDRDHEVLFWFADRRTDALTTMMRDVQALGSPWTVRALRWGTLLVLIGFRRWRHLFGALGAVLLADFIAARMVLAIGRPRPLVEIIGDWTGYSHPSLPVAAATITLVVMGFCLVPEGRWRRRWFVLSGVLVAALSVARVYLGVDHPSDDLASVLLAVGLGVVGFRLFVPDSAFPVRYRRGPKAHLDVGGERGRAIKQAVKDRLGFEVLEIKPFGLKGSAGSTPLRLKVAGESGTYLFAKLRARNHLRSDRWYKLGRTILYGALEDEVRFTSVRYLAEYEDYMLRVMRDEGLPGAKPYGVIEITPEREYLTVTEFFEGAEEISEADIDDRVIDQSLALIRQLWDAGLAHRDIKPSNVLVWDGKVALIDVAFGTVGPTPWRQAVDLANMMLVLALRSDPRRVYERAQRYFAPEDIAEAFAATRGVTIPSQLRTALRDRERAGGRGLVAEFRALAPAREPIRVQRWSARRIGLAAGTLTVVLLFLALLIEKFRTTVQGTGFL